ncbi:hypothetical protein F4815DRAFT_442719 [Daldinia loculata]|nr:hypothetical protein F4815DRAFT_442719 [Daldinia loculata]
MSDEVGSMTVNSNFLKDFIIAIAVAAVSSVVLLTIICLLAQCGPRMFTKVRRREEWLSPTLEEGYQDQSQPELPLWGYSLSAFIYTSIRYTTGQRPKG